MPRNSVGTYSLPPGTHGQPNTTIASSKFNGFVDDVAQDLNTPRPVTAGGTGASSAEEAMSNLGGVSIDYLNSLFRGVIDYFPIATPPDGWLICNGQAISRTTYAELFAIAEASGLDGPLFGPGNGSSTFTIPDLRGEFIRGADLGRGVDEDREVGSFQDQDVAPHTHTGTTNTTGSHTHTYSVRSVVAGAAFTSGSGYTQVDDVIVTGSSGSHSHTVTTAEGGGVESRPRNVALVACIKT